MTDQLPPIRDNRSDAPAPTIRQGRDWPQARDQWPHPFIPLLPICDPWCWIEFGRDVALNYVQATAIMLTWRL